MNHEDVTKRLKEVGIEKTPNSLFSFRHLTYRVYLSYDGQLLSLYVNGDFVTREVYGDRAYFIEKVVECVYKLTADIRSEKINNVLNS